MQGVKLRSLRASVLCIGDASLVFMPGEVKVVQELTAGLEQALVMGWLVREASGVKPQEEEASQPSVEAGRSQSGEALMVTPPSTEAPSLFPPVNGEATGGKGRKKRGGEHAAQ